MKIVIIVLKQHKQLICITSVHRIHDQWQPAYLKYMKALFSHGQNWWTLLTESKYWESISCQTSWYVFNAVRMLFAIDFHQSNSSTLPQILVCTSSFTLMSQGKNVGYDKFFSKLECGQQSPVAKIAMIYWCLSLNYFFEMVLVGNISQKV